MRLEPVSQVLQTIHGVLWCSQVDTACVVEPEGCSDDASEYLTLNIWAPKQASALRLPVLVYICGGSFLAGDGAEELYDCQHLAAKGIVAVTINYRVCPCLHRAWLGSSYCV